MRKKRIVVAMSGGVDSSTAACLLLNQGYDVIGVSMRLFSPEKISDSGCCGVQGIDDAKSVAQKIGIPFYALDYEKEFEKKVISYFCKEYENGRTPNPCVVCNEEMKFGILLKKAESLGADYIATGHYARIGYDKSNKRYFLKKGKDKSKDQSYFLFSLSQEQLSRTLFPLGNYTKNEIRQLAKKFGLRIHDKPASQEICFVEDANYREFIRTRINANKTKPGIIVDTKGNIMGKHKGIAFYTIGQREGIGSYGKPFYVVAIDSGKNKIVIGEKDEVFSDSLIAEDINWIDPIRAGIGVRVKAKIRYQHSEADAVVSHLNNNRVKVRFAKPQRAITPGQAVVFYKGDKVIGGGWIA
ncbi:MAG: tRNA 2-thiouridine(34) synthase MnmA [Elusimicrobia bacterium]|nr:tRNA 2-thiouridine(34) synthase MnmA [Elusimicrobiota bacterium]